MEINALKNKEQLPTDEHLQEVLKDTWPLYEAFRELVIAETSLQPEWRYYHDGNAWLGKMMNKKKNLGWIHVYDGHFKVTFHFLERHLPAIDQLSIADKIKEEFSQAPRSGKLIPMTVQPTTAADLEDLETLILFKKSLK